MNSSPCLPIQGRFHYTATNERCSETSNCGSEMWFKILGDLGGEGLGYEITSSMGTLGCACCCTVAPRIVIAGLWWQSASCRYKDLLNRLGVSVTQWNSGHPFPCLLPGQQRGWAAGAGWYNGKHWSCLETGGLGSWVDNLPPTCRWPEDWGNPTMAGPGSLLKVQNPRPYPRLQESVSIKISRWFRCILKSEIHSVFFSTRIEPMALCSGKCSITW
jgi:hypothetical protein